MHLPVQPPFHLEATVRVLQRRPSNLIDIWEQERYWRAMRIRGRLALIEVRNLGTIDAPDVRLSVLGGAITPRARADAARTACEVLGLGQDPTIHQRYAEAEPALSGTALALRGMRAPRYPDLFETFANVIPFQQLSLEAGMAVVARLVRRFGEVMMLNGRRFHAFPGAEVIADVRIASLKCCGMSMRKAQTLRSVAKAIASGALITDDIAALASSEAIDRLRQLSGIGAWSAALVLLRGFRRLDVFPPGDTGADSSLMTLMHLRSRASLARIIDRFGDCRGYLYFYGLASRLLATGLIHAASPLDSFGAGARSRIAGGRDSTSRAIGRGRCSALPARPQHRSRRTTAAPRSEAQSSRRNARNPR
jgi:3-methyladenine DNA glycosylase/8-oxoguanine DNA glycosylase